MKKRASAYSINRKIKQIRETVSKKTALDTQLVAQTFNQIIYRTRKGEGRVMTYTEARNKLQKTVGDNFRIEEFTQDIYLKEIEQLMSFLTKENRFTEQGEKDYQISHMKSVIQDRFDVNNFDEDFEILKEAFEIANKTQSSGKSKYESGGDFIN